MSELDDRERLASDYVLGQLTSAQRRAVDARLFQDEGLAQAVSQWQARLSPLDELMGPELPPERVWRRIEDQIADATASPRAAMDAAGQVKRWRAAAGAFAALAATLLVALVVFEWERVAPPEKLVGVLQRDGSTPPFILEVDPYRQIFTVRAVSVEKKRDRSYQLWLVSEELPAPKSIGVVGEKPVHTHRPALAVATETVRKATYAVTEEPHGGSPTGKPTSAPVFVGKLFKASP